MIDVERNVVHETTWTGTLTEAEMQDLLLKAVCERAGIGHWEKGLSFSLYTPAGSGFHRFVLVKDELWYMKQADA